MLIREIEPADNKALAEAIKTVLREFNADPKTTVLGDPTVDIMYETYRQPGAIFFVVEDNGKILGGSGIRKLDGTNENICELQRMYLLPAARGIGIGSKLMQMCVAKAKVFGYEKMYLESLSNMKDAYKLYRKNGFSLIEEPLGNTGHGGCNVYMIKNLDN